MTIKRKKAIKNSKINVLNKKQLHLQKINAKKNCLIPKSMEKDILR